MKERKKCCGTCRFWMRANKGEMYPADDIAISDDGKVLIGTCQRFPPALCETKLVELVKRQSRTVDTLPHTEASLGFKWPVLWASDWCGEWKAISEKGKVSA